MKKLLPILATLIFFFLISGLSAQKIKVTKGGFDALKGQETVNIEYTYDNMAVGKFKNEQDYIDKKVSEYNADEPGRGDTWREAWIADREERFEPRFEEEFNDMMQSKGAGMRIASAADYTLIVNTDFTEPGFNIGIARSNAYVDLTVTMIETGNPDNVLAVMTIQ